MTEKFTKKTLKIINFTIKVKDKSQIFYEKTGPKKGLMFLTTVNTRTDEFTTKKIA